MSHTRSLRRAPWPHGPGLAALGLLLVVACVGVDEWVTVRVAREATLDLPPVPNAPARLQVVSYGPEPDDRAELGRCAILLRDPVTLVDWHIDAAQSWEETERRGDTTFVRHTAIGDYIPADLGAYGMIPGQVIRVDCAVYGVLGLTHAGG